MTTQPSSDKSTSTRLRDFVERTASSVLAGVVLYWLAVIFGVLRGPQGQAVLHTVGKALLVLAGLEVLAFAAWSPHESRWENQKWWPRWGKVLSVATLAVLIVGALLLCV